METSGIYFGSLKTFIPSVKLENIRILRTRKHKANRYFSACNMIPRNYADVEDGSSFLSEDEMFNQIKESFSESVAKSFRGKKFILGPNSSGDLM